MAELAQVSDVERLLGRALTEPESDRATADLVALSGRFRREAGQQFTAGTSTVRLKVNGGRIWLPQRPATAVAAVVNQYGLAVPFERNGQWLTLGVPDGDRWPPGSHELALVTYSHGGAVPAEVVDAVAGAVAATFTRDAAAAAGAQQVSRTAGPFTEARTFPAWAVGNPAARLSPDDLQLARSFRVTIPTVWVAQR